MTMHNAPHPDDERLAAYAGGDSDALADASLVAHLSACDRCRPIVDELSFLVGSLAELPDLSPSRPLRLIPPVWDAAPPAGPRSWLRRLTAPAMAAGAGLVLIGAVGFGASAAGNLLPKAASLGAASGPSTSDRDAGAAPEAGSPSLAPADTTGSAAFGSSSAPRSLSSTQPASAASAAPAPAADDSGRTELVTDEGSSPQQPWLTLLIVGVGLFGVSTVLRFSLAPRAG